MLDEPSSEQLRLPVGAGGLGVRASLDLAVPCSFASSFACKKAVQALLDKVTPIAQQRGSRGMEQAVRRTAPGQEEDEDEYKQSAWDEIAVAKSQSLLERRFNADPGSVV